MTKRRYILPFIIWIFFAFPIPANTFVLVIDPGHGGRDSGAVGRKGKEKDINLAVSKLLGQYVNDAHPDVKVVFTRNKDVFIDLNERAEIANKANANLFISIHTNAISKSKSHIKGAEVFTFGVTRNAENLAVAKKENSVILLEDNYEQKYEGFDPTSAESYIIFEFMVNLYADQSIKFASMVQKELVRTAKRSNRGVKQAGFLVLRKSAMPRILVELDFISNSDAENFLVSQAGQRSLARSISNAFTQYKKEFDRLEKSAPIEKAGQRTEIAQTPKQAPASTEQVSNSPATSNQQARPGKVYKIQILASGKKLPEKSPQLKGYKADYYVENKLYKYTYGESANWNEIENLRKKVAKDFKGAFIIAFENGVKVSIK